MDYGYRGCAGVTGSNTAVKLAVDYTVVFGVYNNNNIPKSGGC
jgi:hypothetical protein